MRKILCALLAGALLSFVPTIGRAADRVIYYPLMNPTNVDLNQGARNIRRSSGAFFLNSFGETAGAAGQYANCSVVASSGLSVIVEPANSSQLCSLYQLGEIDSSGIPASLPSGVTGTTLGPDTTLVELDALQATPSSALGPFTAPATSGQSVYELIEAQIQTSDINTVSQLFVDGNGNPFTDSVLSDRSDQIAYQVKAGTPGTSPSEPAVDAGYTAVAYVLVPHGATSCASSCTITAATAFSGFDLAGQSISLAEATSGSSNSITWNSAFGTWTVYEDNLGLLQFNNGSSNVFSVDHVGNINGGSLIVQGLIQTSADGIAAPAGGVSGLIGTFNSLDTQAMPTPGPACAGAGPNYYFTTCNPQATSACTFAVCNDVNTGSVTCNNAQPCGTAITIGVHEGCTVEDLHTAGGNGVYGVEWVLTRDDQTPSNTQVQAINTTGSTITSSTLYAHYWCDQ